MDRGIGEIFTWGVPEFLPPKLSNLEIWEFNIPQQVQPGFTGLLITRDSATGTPIWQLSPGTDVTMKIDLFARNHLDSSLSELETRITDFFASPFGQRTLASETQNFSDCGNPGSELINRVNIWTAPQSTNSLITSLTCDFDGSGTLCPGPSRRCGLSIKLYVLSGSIVAANPKNVMGSVWHPERIN